MNKKILVCSWLSGKLFIDKSSGGSENRAYLLFNEISRYSRYKVSFFVNGNCRKRRINKMNVIFCSNNILKIAGEFLRLIKKQDHVCIFAINRLTPLFIFLAKLNNKKIVYFLTCDADVGVGLENVPSYYKWIPKLTFSEVDVFIAQTEFQYNILKERYKNKKIYLLKNPVIINPNDQVIGKEILWVGRNDNTKGTDILQKIIIENPDKKFKIIGINKKDLSFNFENVNQLGRINQKEMYEHYKISKFIISTSKIEGFPNVFLQAFANNKPIVSYIVNPDNFLEKSRGGFCANGDLKDFQKYVDKLYNSKKKIKEMGNNGYNYIKKEHELKNISKQLIKILDEL